MVAGDDDQRTVEPVTIVVAAATGLGYGRGVLRGVTRYGKLRRGCNVMPMPIESLPDLARWQPDYGFVVQAYDLTLARQMADLPSAVVNVADNHDELPLPTIISDHRAIGAMVAEHFLARGFQRFLFFGPSDWYARLRFQGFREHLDQARPGTVVECIREGETLQRQLSQQRLPVAVMAAHDGVAQGVLNLARQLHLRVPEDVAVVGVDNDELICEAGQIPLSSVAVDAVRIGFEAARAVDHLLSRPPRHPPPIQIVPPLGVVTRQSSEVTAIEDELVAHAVAWLAAHLQQPLTIEDLLEHFPVSRRHLEKRFLAALGRSPAQELRRLRIERVKLLLDTTDLSLSRVAAEAGLASSAVLCQMFQREMGMTPGGYRQRGRLPE